MSLRRWRGIVSPHTQRTQAGHRLALNPPSSLQNRHVQYGGHSISLLPKQRQYTWPAGHPFLSDPSLYTQFVEPLMMHASTRSTHTRFASVCFAITKLVKHRKNTRQKHLLFTNKAAHLHLHLQAHLYPLHVLPAKKSGLLRKERRALLRTCPCTVFAGDPPRPFFLFTDFAASFPFALLDAVAATGYTLCAPFFSVFYIPDAAERTDLTEGPLHASFCMCVGVYVLCGTLLPCCRVSAGCGAVRVVRKARKTSLLLSPPCSFCLTKVTRRYTTV